MTKYQKNEAFVKMLKEFPKVFGRVSFRERLMLRAAFDYVLEEVIPDIRANYDLAIEGRVEKIIELKEEKAEMLDLLKETEVLMKLWLSDEPFTITQHKGLIADTEQLVEKIGEKVK